MFTSYIITAAISQHKAYAEIPKVIFQTEIPLRQCLYCDRSKAMSYKAFRMKVTLQNGVSWECPMTIVWRTA